MSRIHTSKLNFYLGRSTIGSVKARDMIFAPMSISTRAWELNSESRKKNLNYALHDITIYIDAPLNFPARVELFNTIFKLLRLTHRTPGIEPGVGLKYVIVAGVLCQQPKPLSHADNLSGSYCRELFGAMEDIKIHRIFDTQCPHGSERPPSPPPS